MLTHLKTTLDLPDDLLIEAKTLAARRKTTLKAMVESALCREIRPAAEIKNPDKEKFEIGPLGFLVLRRKPGDPQSARLILDGVMASPGHQFWPDDLSLADRLLFPALPTSRHLTEPYLRVVRIWSKCRS